MSTQYNNKGRHKTYLKTRYQNKKCNVKINFKSISGFEKENKWDEWKAYVSNFLKNYKLNNPQISPLFIKQPFDNRPYLNIDIFGHTVTSLLDSGATQTVLGSKALYILEKFNLVLDKNCEKAIHTADGAPQLVSGCVYLPIRAGNICNVLKILIVPTLEHSIILGSDFCKEFLIEINFKDNRWNVNSKLNDCDIIMSNRPERVVFPTLNII